LFAWQQSIRPFAGLSDQLNDQVPALDSFDSILGNTQERDSYFDLHVLITSQINLLILQLYDKDGKVSVGASQFYWSKRQFRAALERLDTVIIWFLSEKGCGVNDRFV
jgi:hypothetical protein